MYLLVRLTSNSGEPGSVFALEFRDEAAARKSLSVFENSDPEEYSVTVENEVGHVLCVRRLAFELAWIANEPPPDPARPPGVERTFLLERLGMPIFEGPNGYGWSQIGDGPIQTGPSRDRVMIWRCDDDAENPEICSAFNDGTSDDWRYQPCRLHQRPTDQA